MGLSEDPPQCAVQRFPQGTPVRQREGEIEGLDGPGQDLDPVLRVPLGEVTKND